MKRRILITVHRSLRLGGENCSPIKCEQIPFAQMAYDESRRKKFISALRNGLEAGYSAHVQEKASLEFVEVIRENFNEEDYPELSGTIQQVDLTDDIDLVLR